ncbi:MAG TPA: SMP-30/gluconolactonase/LRE family protein [Bauldia sp.]|nr:SMP-30/gluconolactonase/LRE family protein [Bauldia sp.]
MQKEFVILNYKRFRTYVVANAPLLRLHTGMLWAEGPVWFADLGILLVSDVPSEQILRFVDGQPPTVFRAPSGNANGNTRDRQGRLITCESGNRRVVRTELDGRQTVLADSHDGKRLNSPNDIVVRSDDSVWFTDPDYGILSDYTGNRAHSELGRRCVFRIDPRSGTTVATDELDKPNGLAFSPDERILYVADSGATHDPGGPHEIVAFDVSADGTLSRRRTFAVIDPGVPDGFRVDVDGNIWTSAADGVHCFTPDGELIGKILVPETVTNLTFGGPKRNRLFITAASSLYSVHVGTRGLPL